MKVGSLVEFIGWKGLERLTPLQKRIHDLFKIGDIYTVSSIRNHINGKSGIFIILDEIDTGNRGVNIRAFKEVQPPMDIKIEDIIEESEICT